MRIGEPLLAPQGLQRLARHVITQFVRTRPKIDTEPYPYGPERYGIIYAPVAAQHWIWDVEGLDPSDGKKRLEGFLEQLAEHLTHSPNPVISDIRPMLAKAEEMMPTMKTPQRRPFVVLHLLFNHFLSDEQRMPSFESVRERYVADLSEPSVEALIAALVLWDRVDWALEEHQKQHAAYFRQRHRSNGLALVRVLETGLTVELAERFRAAGRPDEARSLISLAVENHPGRSVLQDLERNFDPANELDWRKMLLPARG